MGDKLKKELKSGQHKLSIVMVVRIAVTFTLVNFAWIFFRMPSLRSALNLIGKIFTDFGAFSLGPLDPISMVGIGLGLSLLIAREIREEYLLNRLKVFNSSFLKWAIYIVIACFTLAMGVLDAGQFIYVTF